MQSTKMAKQCFNSLEITLYSFTTQVGAIKTPVTCENYFHNLLPNILCFLFIFKKNMYFPFSKIMVLHTLFAKHLFHHQCHPNILGIYMSPASARATISFQEVTCQNSYSVRPGQHKLHVSPVFVSVSSSARIYHRKIYSKRPFYYPLLFQESHL